MMAASAPVSFRLSASTGASFRRAAGKRVSPPAVRARRALAVSAAAKSYAITLLPGDGIGPEIMKTAREVLEEVGSQYDIAFEFTEALVGGAAIDATGVPLPPETLATCQASDAVLLAAIGGYKWDTLPADQRPEQGLLGLRAGLGVRRPPPGDRRPGLPPGERGGDALGEERAQRRVVHRPAVVCLVVEVYVVVQWDSVFNGTW